MKKPESYEYKHMKYLYKIYKVPALLLRDRTLPLFRREILLKRWKDERSRYLFENCHDHDYDHDKQIELITKCLDKIKKISEKNL